MEKYIESTLGDIFLYLRYFFGFIYNPTKQFSIFNNEKLKNSIKFALVNILINYTVVILTYKTITKDQSINLTEMLLIVPIELITIIPIFAALLHTLCKIFGSKSTYEASLSISLVSTIIAPYDAMVFMIISTIEYKMGYSFTFFVVENHKILVITIIVKSLIYIYALYLLTIGIKSYHKLSLIKSTSIIVIISIILVLLGYILGLTIKHNGLI